MAPKCLQCGGKPWTRQCGQSQASTSKAGSANLVFLTEEEAYNSEGTRSSVESALASGKAIIDGGATASVGSIQAVEKIRELAWLRHGKDTVDVMPGETPSFKFGNNGRVVCAATTQVQVPLDGTSGLMNVAVHDVPGLPVLLSIRSLRSLGAVIRQGRDDHDEGQPLQGPEARAC